MLKYMVSMNRKMNQITRQMGEIKSDLRTRSMSPASSQSSSSGDGSTRSKIPCSTKQQLQKLEKTLESNAPAFEELVRCISKQE